jgi:hypothetical protein
VWWWTSSSSPDLSANKVPSVVIFPA